MRTDLEGTPEEPANKLDVGLREKSRWLENAICPVVNVIKRRSRLGVEELFFSIDLVFALIQSWIHSLACKYLMTAYGVEKSLLDIERNWSE